MIIPDEDRHITLYNQAGEPVLLVRLTQNAYDYYKKHGKHIQPLEYDLALDIKACMKAGF